ncbi:hypothetical protein STEG23_031973 [Scotinomys teguina]
MARKAGQGKEEEESRARQQEEKTPVREEEEKPACHGGAHHVVEQANDSSGFSKPGPSSGTRTEGVVWPGDLVIDFPNEGNFENGKGRC